MARPLFVKNSNASWVQASDYNINNGSWTRGKLIYVKTDKGWEHEHEYQNFRETSVANCVDEQEYVYDCPCYETGAYSNTYYGTTDPNNHKGSYSYIGAVNYDTTYHTKKYKCVACGQAAPAQDSLEAHTASSAWTYDSSKHWHVCTAACGAKLNEASHVAAANMTWDTSDHWYPCTSNCGVKLSQAAHDYYPTSYNADTNDPDNYHWSQQDCKVCDYTNQIERLPHTLISSYSPYLDLTHLTTTWCELCGYYTKVNEEEYHEFSTNYFYDNQDYQHWKVCEQCGSEGNTREQHSKVTYGAFSGKLDYDIHTWYCTTSGCSWEKQEAHTLTWNSNSSQHWKQCEVCGAGTGVNGNDSNHFPLTTPVAHDNPVSSYLDQSTTGHYRLTICSTCNGTMFDTWEDHTPDYSTWLSDNNEHWRKCSGCDYEKIQAAPHRDPGVWESQANYHYKYCADGCGQFYGREEHIESGWKNDNPEGHYKECTVCEYEMVAPQPHLLVWRYNLISHWEHCTTCEWESDSSNHTPSNYWSSNATYHWKDCAAGCGYEMDKDTHNPQSYWGFYDGSYHYKYCDDCGWNVETSAHTPSSTWSTSGSSHWHECTANCGYQSDFGNHYGSWTSYDDNYHQKLCATCDYVINGLTPHDAVGGWEYSDYYHWKTCYTCNGTLYWNAHTTPSTWDTGDDSKHYKYCTCGKVMDSGTHYGSYESDEYNHWKNCSTCGKSMVSTTAHSLGGWQTDSSTHWKICSTCDAKVQYTSHVDIDGWETDSVDHWKVCRDCGYRTGSYIAHSGSWDWDSYNHWKNCSTCGYDMEYPTAHSGSWEYDNYNHWKYCSTCGYTMVSSKSHDLSGWDWSDTWHWKDCTTCGARTNYQQHSYSDSITTQPSCTTNGVRTYSCDCGKYYTESIAAFGHTDIDGWRTDSVDHWKVCATCGTRTGNYIAHSGSWDYNEYNHWKYCSTCGYTMVSSTSHDLGSWDYSSYYHWRDCTTCGARTNYGGHSNPGYWNAYNGSYHYKNCTDCNYNIESGSHSGSWDYDTDYHWKNCSACGYSMVSRTGHSMTFSSDENYEYYTCSGGCGYYNSFSHSPSYSGWGDTFGGSYHNQFCPSCGHEWMHQAGKGSYCSKCDKM